MNNNETYSLAAINRLPNYMRFLLDLNREGKKYVTSNQIAKAMGLTSVLVKKDLNPVLTSAGKPKVGYLISDLINDLKNYLGYDKTKRAVIVGVGHLGKALLAYQGFENYGIDIVLAFDNNKHLIDQVVSNRQVFPIEEAKTLIQKYSVEIGIICVPKEHAQKVCDLLIESGVKGIWNFAPTHLKGNDKVAIKNEDIASSLAILTNMMIKERK